MNPARLFIAFEGIDASGKATQSALLAERLKAELFSFPAYDTPFGKLIKAHLEKWWYASWDDRLTGDDVKKGWAVQDQCPPLDPMALQAMMLANRMEMAAELSKKRTSGCVVADRYWASGYAYGRADGLDGDHLLRIHEYLPQPDLSILLDVDVSDSLARRPERRDRYERDTPLLEKVRGYYLELWERKKLLAPLEWVVVNARGAKEETQAQVNAAVQHWRQAHGAE